MRSIKSVTLKPGQSCFVKHATGGFPYNAEINDVHNLAYQVSHKGFAFMVSVCGVPAHDSTASDQVGLIQGKIDYIEFKEVVVRYDAGAAIKYLEMDDNLDSFTNAANTAGLDVEKNAYAAA